MIKRGREGPGRMEALVAPLLFWMVGVDPGKAYDFAFSEQGGEKITWKLSREDRARLERRDIAQAARLARKRAERATYSPRAGKNIDELLRAVKPSESCALPAYCAYAKRQLEADACADGYFHRRKVYRKDKMNEANARRRAKALVVQSFRDAFGGPDEVAIAMGDWNRARTSWLVSALVEAGYLVAYLDEYRTTKACSRPGCCGECHRFMDHGNGDLAWKIIKCDRCGVVYMRDWNEARNLFKAAVALQRGAARPPTLARPMPAGQVRLAAAAAADTAGAAADASDTANSDSGSDSDSGTGPESDGSDDC